GKGALTIELADGTVREIGITRLHLEQDAGKSLHDQHPSKSYIDLNRAGVALMEIVSEPDLRSPEEAGLYLRKLRTILRYLGTCDGNMEEGSLRADVNVSVRHPGEGLRTRCEIKNVNSVRFVMQAIEFEAHRHVEVWEAGGEVLQETRLFDAARGVTRSMRSKEEAHDYRYLPDPDLVPLILDPAWIEQLRAALPELPDAKKARFISGYGLSAYDSAQLVADAETADYFELLAAGRQPKTVANLMLGDLQAALHRLGQSFASTPIFTAEAASALLDLIADGTINGRIAKEVIEEMEVSGEGPGAIVARKDLRQVTDSAAIEAAVTAVLARESAKVAEFRAGKEKLFGYFVGQVMKAMAGKANPALVNEALKQRLS
ncbi:MAG: Asp-tRNA(Asn)/Glu-tRNA(Gln) amidotransferase subunit GatB, partial [Acetobacteraceae bacterium]